jgi:hypothetical protein
LQATASPIRPDAGARPFAAYASGFAANRDRLRFGKRRSVAIQFAVRPISPLLNREIISTHCPIYLFSSTPSPSKQRNNSGQQQNNSGGTAGRQRRR